MNEADSPLENAARLREQPFRSDVPVLGPLIAWFRARWNEVAARWFVLPLVEQQNAFNALAVEQLMAVEDRLIAQDRLLTELTHQLAELTARLAVLNRELSDAAGSQVDTQE